MIRQSITCDICSIERKQANHWFEAYERDGELRLRSLLPAKSVRPGLKHLCGQTCLHRLVDDFLAGAFASPATGRNPTSREENFDNAESFSIEPQREPESIIAKSISANRNAPDPSLELDEYESSARLIPSPAPALTSKPVPAQIAGLASRQSARSTSAIAANNKTETETLSGIPIDTKPVIAATPRAANLSTSNAAPSQSVPQHRRAEAWERERARARQTADRPATPSKKQKAL